LLPLSGIELVRQQAHSFQEEREQGSGGSKSLHREAGWNSDGGGDAECRNGRRTSSVSDNAEAGIGRQPVSEWRQPGVVE